MLFENAPVDIASLPGSEELNFHRLDSNYLKVKMINQLIIFLIILVGAVIFQLFNNGMEWKLAHGILLLTWLMVYLVSMLFMRKAFVYKGYVVREKDVVYRKGWLWKSTLIVPFNRIQHCELSQGPFEKMFNLSKLNVYTAGGQSSDLKLPGLSTEEATKIKTFLLNQINESKLNPI